MPLHADQFFDRGVPVSPVIHQRDGQHFAQCLHGMEDQLLPDFLRHVFQVRFVGLGDDDFLDASTMRALSAMRTSPLRLRDKRSSSAITSATHESATATRAIASPYG